MQCISCNSEIDPKWKHAIDRNSCPFCGEIILPEELKSLLSTLNDSLSQLKEKYQTQLDDWILSNFKYVRTDSPKMEDFRPKAQVVYKEIKTAGNNADTETDEEQVQVQNPEVTNKFFKNAGALNAAGRTQELKKMVEQIKSEKSINPGVVTPDILDDESEDSISNYSDDSEIPAQVLAFSNMNKSPTYNMKDAIKLQQMQQRVQESRNNMINGTGGKGSFSRSG